MLTLAALVGSASVQAGDDPAQALALGGVVSLVPATAQRLRVPIESVWAMPAERGIDELSATAVDLASLDAQAQLPALLDHMRHAFAAESMAKRIRLRLAA